MNTAIFYDTETTGLPDWSSPSNHPNQPHIVQLAALLVDLDTQKTLSSIDLIVKPDGWEITKESSEIHGITHEMAMDLGVDESLAMNTFLDLYNDRLRIGHNESFDARILRIAIKRYVTDDFADHWKDGDSECTASMSKNIVNCPPTEKMIKAGRRHAKTPTLQEAYNFFFGKDFEGTHNAMADVMACRDVYFKCLELKKAA